MQVSLLATLLASTSLTTVSLADTSSMSTTATGMGVLENEWVKAGVNGNTGTFGSGGNTSPGLLFDPNGTGTFNSSYDYLTPGSPFDGFSVKVDGTNYTNNNTGSTGITGDGNGLTDGTDTLSWTGGVSSVFDITNSYSLADNTPFIDVTSSITMSVDADSVSFGKFIDPDSQGMPGDSSSTDNVLGYGVIPSTNLAFSEATESRYALGIYTTDTNVTAGINGWETDADAYNGTNYTDADGNNVLYGNGDDTIGISWTWTGVSSGDILTASYAYIFGPSAFDAAEDAVDGGAGGGDTTTTDSWGTVSDVGSATDAAESGATGSTTPTVVSTTTETITSTSEATSTTLPVLTASITHHEASEAGAIQTIAREKTTTVTTPVNVTTTSFDRTTTTYSDGSETVTDGESTSTTVVRNDSVTTVTDPGSFTGRIDQIATAQDSVSATIKGLDFNGVTAIGKKNKFDNGMKGDSKGFTAGGTKVTESGIIIGAGFAAVETKIKNGADRASATTRAGQLKVGKSFPNADIVLKATHAMTDYTSLRTIGDFNNSAATSGTDSSVNLQFKAKGYIIQPIVGYTVGRTKLDGYAETGSIQSARTVAGDTDMYNYGTFGATANLFDLVDITGLYHTDGTTEASVGINKTVMDNGSTIGVNASRIQTDLGSSNSITAGINIKF